jgi:hypothetical protein
MAARSLPTTLREHIRARLATLGPKFDVASAEKDGDATTYQLTGEHLVELDDTDRAHPLNVAIPVPITVRARRNTILDVKAAEPSADEERQARMFAKDLIARGAVKGLSGSDDDPGPPRRPTHAIYVLADGRRVIRRLGFDIR